MRGRALVEQGRGPADLGPTDLVLVDPARPARFASTASAHVSILVPRRELRLRPGDADRLTGVRIKGDRGPGALVSSLARDLGRSLSGFRAGEAQRSAAAVTALIAVTLEAQLNGDVRTGPDDALRDRVVGYIEARLSDRGLSPGDGRRGPPHLRPPPPQALRGPARDGPGALIRRRRLERCRADLTPGRTVTAVAARWGFHDPAYFSRVFKAAYGYSPAALNSGNRAREAKAPGAGPGQDGGS